jgi:23S rRNA (adenine-N6)-dimethyltransferase
MPRSIHGGRHELGQNFLTHAPTITTITELVSATDGPILELGAGDGALTRHLARTGRSVTAIDIDEHRVRRLAQALPAIDVVRADALRHPLDTPVVVGNIPFHLTTPIMRRLLRENRWMNAVLITQWEVARKRAGVGGQTMMTAQNAPWFEFTLQGRVPSSGFRPRPSVDGGVLAITRRREPLVSSDDRGAYVTFVRAVFTGPGGTLERVIQRAAGIGARAAREAVAQARIVAPRLPRDLTPEQWAALWQALPRPSER